MALGGIITDRTGEIGNSVGKDIRGQLHVLAALKNNPLPEGWKSVSVSYPTSTQEIYSYYSDSNLTGSVVGTLTINYTDATKTNLASWSV